MESKSLSVQMNVEFRLELPPVYEGPLSKVYRAQDLGLRRTVGIKEVDLQNVPKKNQVTIQSELNVWCDYASKTSKLPQIYSVIPSGKKYYIVMQWIEGCTLRELINAGTLSFSRKLDYALQLCDALAPIHRRQMQHRDLKPENIRIDNGQKLYLMDFNISAAVPHSGIGTDGYLPPECLGLSQQSSASRVDVFAIGIILFELFTGSIPVWGLDYYCEPQDKTWRMFMKPSERAPELPKAIDLIVEKCMALQWKDRYSDAAAVARDLKPLKRRSSNGGGKR